jgi:hypothetical protein
MAIPAGGLKGMVGDPTRELSRQISQTGFLEIETNSTIVFLQARPDHKREVQW